MSIIYNMLSWHFHILNIHHCHLHLHHHHCRHRRHHQYLYKNTHKLYKNERVNKDHIFLFHFTRHMIVLNDSINIPKVFPINCMSIFFGGMCSIICVNFFETMPFCFTCKSIKIITVLNHTFRHLMP